MPAQGKGFGIGALERIDRLLFVAYGEDRTGARSLRADWPAKGSPQPRRVDHGPLVGAGVLRLVEQDVIDALVELVLQPRHSHRAGQAD